MLRYFSNFIMYGFVIFMQTTFPQLLVADPVLYKVTTGSTEQINKHGVCKDVTNATGKDIMIPTRTSAEWTSFQSNLPGGVSLADCDLCPGVTTIGHFCPNGARYGGTFNYGGSIGTKKILITPGGCTSSSTPTCMNGPDETSRIWSSSVVTSGASSTTDGLDNTNKILIHEPTAPTAKYCADMVFAGMSDWYVPARDELTHIYTNRVSLTESSFNTIFWSSTEAGGGGAANTRDFTSGSTTTYGKGNSMAVRCIMRY